MKKICSSPKRCKQFRKFAKDAYGSKPAPAPSNKLLYELMVIRDVVTRWNYTHAMIKRAILLRKVSACHVQSKLLLTSHRLSAVGFSNMRRCNICNWALMSGHFWSSWEIFLRYFHHVPSFVMHANHGGRFLQMSHIRCQDRRRQPYRGPFPCTSICKNPSKHTWTTWHFLLAFAARSQSP